MTDTTTAPLDATAVADLERQAAEAAERAAQARDAIAERARVETAARDRAHDNWTREQFEARRPHDAVKALDDAWDQLVEHLVAGDVPMMQAWAAFATVRAQSAVIINMCAGFVGAPQLARRWDQHHREHLTIHDAINAAVHRAAPPSLLEQASEALDAERAAAGDAAVAVLADDAAAEPVAYFHDRAGWPDRLGLADVQLEHGTGGVARVFTAPGAHAVRQAITAARVGGFEQPIREIGATEAARLELAAAHGEDETTSSVEADAARAAHHAERVKALPYTAGKPAGRRRGQLAERSDAAPAVDPDRP